MKEDTPPAPSVEKAVEDESWAYMVLEPRETYDPALSGLLELNSVSTADTELTHCATYCRIKTLIALSTQFTPRISWNEVLEYHYYNQDSSAHPPFPLFLDPPEGWEEMPQYSDLLREYTQAVDACPPEEGEEL